MHGKNWKKLEKINDFWKSEKKAGNSFWSQGDNMYCIDARVLVVHL